MLFNEYNKIFHNVIEMEINRNIRYQLILKITSNGITCVSIDFKRNFRIGIATNVELETRKRSDLINLFACGERIVID